VGFLGGGADGSFLWHVVFSATIGLYLASCVVAIRAATRLGALWVRRA
jgi:hypothetical protein